MTHGESSSLPADDDDERFGEDKSTVIDEDVTEKVNVKATIHGATLLLATVVTWLYNNSATGLPQPCYNCCKQQSCPVYGGLYTIIIVYYQSIGY